MNKELIKKYKTEFDHWLNGGKVISKYTLIPTWSNCQSEDIWRIPDKNISKVLIVINDEYATYRKALAEGKVVEVATDYNDVDGYIWKSMEDKEFHYFSIDEIRIKPEEPQFKAGNWVVHPDAKAPWKLSQNSINHLDNSKLELWQPQLGERWWFWDSGNFPELRQFKRILISNKYESYQTFTYDYCEPFLGKLPTTLKGL